MDLKETNKSTESALAVKQATGFWQQLVEPKTTAFTPLLN